MNNTFQDLLREKLNESDSFPHTTTFKNNRVVSCLVQTGTGIITVTLKNGDTITTPRIPEQAPYIAYFDNPIETITIAGATVFDIELLERGVS